MGVPGKAGQALLGKGRAAQRLRPAACGGAKDAQLVRTREDYNRAGEAERTMLLKLWGQPKG